ncbi:MAG: type IV pilus assembly protein PilM [Candidatus Saccharimonadales bacterium]|jgi:type IV pilus assembly protein PilM
MKSLYKDKPVFGFDIGRSSIKVLQINQLGSRAEVVGYGTIQFEGSAINDQGIIVDHEAIILAAHKLLSKGLVGHVTTKRVAVSLPNANSFSRVLTLPKMDDKDLKAAVSAEVDQSIPLPSDELYYDYSVTRILEDEGMQEVQVVATPSSIVDSYVGVFDALGLEIALIESNITSTTRIVVHAEAHDVNTLIVDIGSTSCDISIYDGSAIRATGTVDCSSERLTANIASELGISIDQAHSIKTRYGLESSKKQALIIKAAEPELNKLINEIRKVMRYFTDRSNGSTPIGQIIILGGGANLPGLATYITNRTRVAARLCSPWNNLSFGKLQPPHELETTLYTTAGGLGLVTQKELES